MSVALPVSAATANTAPEPLATALSHGEAIHSRMHSPYRTPDWLPLERALKAELGSEVRAISDAFWFVGFVDGPADVGELRVYEHSATKRQLTLGSDGRAYKYFDEIGGYGSLGSDSPLMSALAGAG